MAIKKLTRNVRQLGFSTPLYALWLRVPQQGAIEPPPTDPWPGDAVKGAELLDGVYDMAGYRWQGQRPNWAPAQGSESYLTALHGFDWLRHLRALGGDGPRRQARRLVGDWMKRCHDWRPIVWRADVLGQRLSSWLVFHHFFLDSADDEFRQAAFRSIARQARHLLRTVGDEVDGERRLSAAKGLLTAGLALAGGAKAGEDERVLAALDVIETQLPRLVLADGCPFDRNPQTALTILKDCVELRSLLSAYGLDTPQAVEAAIPLLAQSVRFFRLGDGALSLFNGAQAQDPIIVEAILDKTGLGGRAPKSLPHGGFERLQAGRSVLIADLGRPVPAGRPHAGTLSFELSVGRQRVVGNCGAAPANGVWAEALRATAAHSTLTLNDTNSSELLPGGGLGRRPRKPAVERHESDGAQMLLGEHDGYGQSHGVIHRRRLTLADNGDVLIGQEMLTSLPGRQFAVRFHLHPMIQASQTQDGDAILVKVSAANVWRFEAEGLKPELEESRYFGQGATPRRALQIVLNGTTEAGDTSLGWRLMRERG